MSSLFTRSLERMQSNMVAEHNCIPFEFQRFRKFIPGIQKSKYYLVTASSGVGKTQIADYMFLHTPYEFMTNNPESEITVKIFYYSLEMDKLSKIFKWACYKMFKEHGIYTTPNQLQSIGENRCSQELYDKYVETRDYFEKMEEHVIIHDEGINPYGIFKEVTAYAMANGTVHKKQKHIYDNATGEVSETIEVFDYYVPNNPNEYVIILVDHIGLITTEKGKNLHETITKLSSKDLIQLRNKYGYIPVVVQQQAAEKEKQEFTFKGQSIESKLEPSLDGLADNKLTQRDANLVFGLFAPNRYGIESHRGFDILRLQDYYRSLSVLKNREGISNIYTPLYFHGASGLFRELPKAKEMTKEQYAYVERQIKEEFDGATGI